MCTGLTLKTKDEYTLFGRNMDLAYQFNQSVIITPRNFKYIDEFDGKEKQPKYASMGMASIIDNFPCYADGFNEKGVACAGLNFPQMAYFESDIDDDNPYNTRGDNPKLISVGPISNPGKDAIEAVLKPIKTDYYYFVSDKNNKVYFTKTFEEHEKVISKLQDEGLWLEW